MAITTDIEVLREMIRLAERRRDEEFEHIERVNRYNLALIAFSGSFLSLLVTSDLPIMIVEASGFFLIISVICSLLALRPRMLQGGTLVIDNDVVMVQNGHRLALNEYLLATADLTDYAASAATTISLIKKRWTINAAAFLAFALFIAYILYVYAQTR